MKASLGADGPSDPRRIALDILRASSRGRRLDLALRDQVPALSDRDRGWVRELTYGVARLRGRLDFLLASHVHRRLETLEPVVLDLLRAGAYQILYMGGVPTYAAVSSTVELSRRIGPRPAVGLINAVPPLAGSQRRARRRVSRPGRRSGGVFDPLALPPAMARSTLAGEVDRRGGREVGGARQRSPGAVLSTRGDESPGGDGSSRERRHNYQGGRLWLAVPTHRGAGRSAACAGCGAGNHPGPGGGSRGPIRGAEARVVDRRPLRGSRRKSARPLRERRLCCGRRQVDTPTEVGE